MTFGHLLAKLAESGLGLREIKDLELVDSQDYPFTTALVSREYERLWFSKTRCSDDHKKEFDVVIQEDDDAVQAGG